MNKFLRKDNYAKTISNLKFYKPVSKTILDKSLGFLELKNLV